MHWTSASATACLLALALLGGCRTHPTAAKLPSSAIPAGVSVALLEPRPGVYPAGQPGAAAWAGIAARGIGTVVNLRTAAEMQDRDEAAEVRTAGMRYIEIPVEGAGGIDDANALRLREALLAAPGPVLVHCASGNRVGALLALGEARHAGATPEQAIEFGRKAGMRSTEARVRELLGQPANECAVAARDAVTGEPAPQCP